MAVRVMRLPSGSPIPTLGLGTWRLWGDEGLAAMRAALELGYRHLDTAEAYGNHEIVGQAIRDYDRAEVFITSKVPPERLHYDEVLACCDQALLEIGTDYLDLLLIHWPNPEVPMPQTFEALGELIELGKARDIGVSNFQPHRLARALKVSPVPIATNQVEMHPLLYQHELMRLCHDNGIIVTAYAPLARGKVFEEPVIVEIAQRLGRTPAQVSLRWLLQKGCIVIPRSTREEHLRENMDIYGWELSLEDEARIDALDRHERLIQNATYGEFED